MSRTIWVALLIGVLMTVSGRGILSLIGAIIFAVIPLLLGFKLAYDAVQAIQSGVPAGRVIALAFGAGATIVATLWLLVLPLVPWDTWLVRDTDARVVTRMRALAVTTTDVASMDVPFLERFAESLAGSRIVGLGESYHWTSQYSTAKTSIIRYLHEHAGFDVVLFESPIAPLHLAMCNQDSALDAGRRVRGLFACWQTEEVAALFAYADSTRSTARPLHICGVDPQHFGADFLAADKLLRRAIAATDSTRLPQYEVSLADWRNVMSKRGRKAGTEAGISAGSAFLRGLAGDFRRHAKERMPADPDEVTELLIAAMVANGVADGLVGQELPRRERYLARDRGMANAVGQYADSLFAGKRVVVWAHNAHLWKEPAQQVILRFDPHGQLEQRAKYGSAVLAPNMGQILAEKYGSGYFAVALLGSSGRVGTFRPGDWRLVRWRRPDSLEKALRPDSGQATYLPLRAFAEGPGGRSAMTMLNNRVQWRRIIPADQFDGVLVVRALTPPSRI